MHVAVDYLPAVLGWSPPPPSSETSTPAPPPESAALGAEDPEAGRSSCRSILDRAAAWPCLANLSRPCGRPTECRPRRTDTRPHHRRLGSSLLPPQRRPHDDRAFHRPTPDT